MIKYVSMLSGHVIEIEDTKIALAIDLADREDMDVLVYEDGTMHLWDSNEKGVGECVRVSSFGVEDAELFDAAGIVVEAHHGVAFARNAMVYGTMTLPNGLTGQWQSDLNADGIHAGVDYNSTREGFVGNSPEIDRIGEHRDEIVSVARAFVERGHGVVTAAA